MNNASHLTRPVTSPDLSWAAAERGSRATSPASGASSPMSMAGDSDDEDRFGPKLTVDQDYCWVDPTSPTHNLSRPRGPGSRSRSASGASEQSAQLPSLFGSAQTSREASPKAVREDAELLAASTATLVPQPAPGSPPEATVALAPKVEASRVAATATKVDMGHGRDLLFLGIGIALATGAAVTHEHWLTPALQWATPYYRQLAQTCQHLADGAEGFAYAYRHGVPQAIYGSDGQVLPCQTVVHTQLVAPLYAGVRAIG